MNHGERWGVLNNFLARKMGPDSAQHLSTGLNALMNGDGFKQVPKTRFMLSLSVLFKQGHNAEIKDQILPSEAHVQLSLSSVSNASMNLREEPRSVYVSRASSVACHTTCLPCRKMQDKKEDLPVEKHLVP